MKWMTLLAGVVGLATAEPTESRVWTATNGKTVEGSVLRVDGGQVVLKRADGPEVKVPMTAFVEEDRKVLEEHFELGAAGSPGGSGAAAAEGLPHEQGKVLGPFEAGDGANYFLYLPKSLKQDRKAPMLFYADSGGGKPRQLSELIEGAEMCGWVMAASVESSNNAGFEANRKVCRTTVEHLIETLPIDPDRIYYTGNSGGGAQSMLNAADLPTGGAMPNIGYIPQGAQPKKAFYYVLGGGNDYNRYLSAHIGKKFGKNAVHRMNPGGHSGAPSWQRIDGMVWLNAHFLEEERRDHQEESLDFEASVIQWLQGLPEGESHRAYSNARVMKDDYEISGDHLALIDTLINELGSTESNVMYHEGLAEIDEFSEDEFAELGEGGGSKFKHSDSSKVKKIEKLLEKYRGVPVIEPTLEAMAKPTVGK